MGTGKTYSTKYLLDSNNNSGADGQVLISTSTGIDWVDANTVPGIIGGPFLPLSAGASYPLTATLYGTGANFSSNVEVENQLTINIDDISTGENRGLKLNNYSGTAQVWNVTAGQTGVDNDKFTIRDSTNDVNALTIVQNGGVATFAGAGTFGGNVTGARAFFNSGTTNVVATFTSTDGIAGIGLIDSTGNVELSAAGDVFQVQPAGGTAQLTVSDSITKVSGMLNIVGSRSTYVDNAEDDTATAHIFTTDAEVGDFDQLAGSLVLQARVNDAIYRDIIFAGGLGTTADPVTPLMTILGEGRVGIGTNSPDVQLEVSIASPTDGIVADFVNSTNAGGTVAAIKLSNHDSEACDVVLGANRVGANFGSDFFISLSDAVDGTNQERLRINESGNVGINVTNPGSARLQVLGNVIFDGHSLTDPDTASRTAYPAAQMFTHYDEANGVSIIGGQGGFSGTGLTIGEETGRSSAFTFIRGVSDTNGGANASNEFWIDGVGNSYFSGLMGIGSAPAARKLEVSGITKTFGYMNTDNYMERVLGSVVFLNGVANQNVDIVFGNVSFWGYIELEITGTYSNQNTSGKYTKVYAVGCNPANSTTAGVIYTNESRVVDNLGYIKDNIAFGDFRFDGTDDTGTFAIKLSHIVSTGNNYTVKVRVFTHGSNGSNGASGVMNNIGYTAVYTEAALTREYVHYNDRVGIGTSTPSALLHVKGGNGVTGVIKVEGGNNTVAAEGEINSRLDFGSNDGSVWSSGNIGGRIASVTEATNGALVGMAFSTFKQGTSSPDLLSEKVRIRNNGNVGIGTPSPSAKLQVSSDISDGIVVRTTEDVEPFVAIQRNDGSNGVGVLRLMDGGDLKFDTGATGSAQSTKFIVGAAGEVTLSSYTMTQQTAASAYLLGVDSSGKIVQSTNIPAGTGGSAGPYLPLSGGTITGSLSIVGDIRGNNPLILNAGESYAYATSQTGEFVYVNAEQGLRVNSSPDNWTSGWAGRNSATICASDGSSSFPGAVTVNSALTVNNNLATLSGSAPLFAIINSTEDNGGILFQDAQDTNQRQKIVYNSSDGSLRFLRLNADNESMRIKNTGFVGIGGNDPAYLLDVRDGTQSGSIARFSAINPHVIIESSTAGNSVLHFKPNATSSKSGQFKVTAGNGYNFKWTNDAAGTGETIYMDLDTSTTGGGDLTVKGDIIAYGAPSDRKYKENIKPIESALDKAMQLQGVTFDWKDSESILDIKEDIGFIAQDVEKVLPELVRDNGKGNLSLRYQGVTPILLEAIKELKAEIEELKKQIK